jgi:hypothetical protein
MWFSPRPAMAASETVNIWLTSTNDSGGRNVTRGLQQQAPISFGPSSPSANQTITINENTRYQQFVGAGASFTDTAQGRPRRRRTCRDQKNTLHRLGVDRTDPHPAGHHVRPDQARQETAATSPCARTNWLLELNRAVRVLSVGGAGCGARWYGCRGVCGIGRCWSLLLVGAWGMWCGGAQCGERGAEVAERHVGERRAQPSFEFLVEDRAGSVQQALAGGRELDDGGAAVGRVGASRAVPAFFEPIDCLACASDRDREGGGDVIDPAGLRALDDEHHVHAAQGESALLLEPRIDLVPQVGLETHQVVEDSS